MVHVQLGSIQTAGMADNAGIFSGQNIQNAWDSHGGNASAFGSNMGDYSLGVAFFSILHSFAHYGQPIYDQDVKGNGMHVRMS